MMHPIRVGLVGTGYAAKVRAESFQADERSQLVAVAGHDLDHTQAFCQVHQATAVTDWTELLQSDLDLIVIATINSEHGAIAKAALQAGKHVVVEYPLSIRLQEAIELRQLATQQQRLLHVEHIELLSGIHQATQAALPTIGAPFYVRYTSLNRQTDSQKWTYRHSQFGFPLIGAVSRIHRLTNLFGAVATVSCRASYRYVDSERDRYSACLCTAQLQFCSGLIAEVVYGKGDQIWQKARTLEIHAAAGGILIDGEQGQLVQPDQTRSLEIGSRRGLFARDTAMLLDHLLHQTPLYVSLSDSLYALKVADAAQRSAETGQTIAIAA